MIREALQYIVGLGMNQHTVTDENGHVWVHGGMSRIKPPIPQVQSAICLGSLKSVVQYMKEAPDGDDFSVASPSIIVVDSPTLVRVLSGLDEEGHRSEFLRAEYTVPEFEYGHFMPVEAFVISLRRYFEPTTELSNLLQFVAAIKVGEGAEIKDNGISQEVTTRRGIDMAQEAVPNPVTLYPRRGFPELNPVPSPFLLRLRQQGSSQAAIALFETDGGLWQVQARLDVAAWLRLELGEEWITEQGVTILS